MYVIFFRKDCLMALITRVVSLVTIFFNRWAFCSTIQGIRAGFLTATWNGDSWRTLPETNIAPKNGWLEYYFPIGMAYFQGRAVSFREGIFFWIYVFFVWSDAWDSILEKSQCLGGHGDDGGSGDDDN